MRWAGAIAGLVLGAVLASGYWAMDRGTAATYSADELAFREDERVLLRVIAADLLHGQTTAEVEVRLARLGLHDLTTDEEGVTLIVASRDGRPGQVVIEAADGVVARIRDDCDRIGACEGAS